MDFIELINRLKTYDEITLLEVLEITSEELVDRFNDKVEEHQIKLSEDLSEETDSEIIDEEDDYDYEDNEYDN